MKFAYKALTASVILACAGSAMAQKGETVKVAWIDPLSGLMAALGSNQLKSLQYAAEGSTRPALQASSSKSLVLTTN